jgi:hypothetical protein
MDWKSSKYFLHDHNSAEETITSNHQWRCILQITVMAYLGRKIVLEKAIE